MSEKFCPYLVSYSLYKDKQSSCTNTTVRKKIDMLSFIRTERAPCENLDNICLDDTDETSASLCTMPN